MKIINEFKEFIARGNVVDMAVGVVVGGAFKSIVDSLVADIITPIITMCTGKADVTELSCSIGSATLTYGNFLQSIINFLIIAFVVFMMVKSINTVHDRFLKKEEKTAPEEDPKPTAEDLLTEIRDLLKTK